MLILVKMLSPLKFTSNYGFIIIFVMTAVVVLFVKAMLVRLVVWIQDRMQDHCSRRSVPDTLQ